MNKNPNQFDECDKVLPIPAWCEYGFDEDELSDEAVAYYLVREAEKTLTDEEVTAFKAHISSCPSCRDTYTRVKTVLTLLKGNTGPLPVAPITASGAAGG
jgi:hypothetical protein